MRVGTSMLFAHVDALSLSLSGLPLCSLCSLSLLSVLSRLLLSLSISPSRSPSSMRSLSLPSSLLHAHLDGVKPVAGLAVVDPRALAVAGRGLFHKFAAFSAVKRKGVCDKR